MKNALNLLLNQPLGEKELRTYTSFSHPIDPAVINTISDMDLSYALASTLVEWSPNNKIIGGITSEWKTDGNKIIFKIRPDAKWSNGDMIRSHEIVLSFRRHFDFFTERSRSFFLFIESMEVINDQFFSFTITHGVPPIQILKKLTEPNFGLLKINEGRLELNASSGPFSLESSNKREIVLSVNPHWHRSSPNLPEKVLIRQQANREISVQTMLTDQWPNFIEVSSLMGTPISAHLKDHPFELWTRSIDKLMHIGLVTKSATDFGVDLLSELNRAIKKDALKEGLSGLIIAQQIFPNGHLLNIPELCSASQIEVSANNTQKRINRSIRVLFARQRIFGQLKENLRKMLTEATLHEPEFFEVDLYELNSAKTSVEADIYVGQCGLADPDPDGMLSFLLEGPAPPIFSTSRKDFVKDLDSARKLNAPSEEFQRNEAMKAILNEAVERGHIIPLFHFSTVGIARHGIDLSRVSSTDESVAYSKIRFKI